MKTKDKILQVALELFNDKGVDLVSSKQISDEMGISYGNLCYHYPKKDDIIMQLYLKQQGELDQEFKGIGIGVPDFEMMFGALRKMLEVLIKYKFLYLGLTSLVKRFPDIRKDVLAKADSRADLMRKIVAFLVMKNLAKPEKGVGHYDKLIHLTLIMLNSWIADSEVFYEGKPENMIDEYLEIFYSFMKPSLTQEGLEVFNQYYKKGMSSLPAGGL